MTMILCSIPSISEFIRVIRPFAAFVLRILQAKSHENLLEESPVALWRRGGWK
jgi:hypothetical protein